MQNIAEVKLWGKLVGALVYQTSSQTCIFEYAPAWIKGGVEIAPVRMPLALTKYQFSNLNSDTYRGLPAVFADALPDDFGNAVINAWLAKQGRDSESFTALERLLYTGQRSMGALEFAPALRRGATSNEKLELNSLVAMAQSVLDKRTQVSSSMTEGHAMDALFQVGTSAGGARAKALIAINQDRTQIRSGQADAPTGFEHYLLKFDGVEESRVTNQVFGDPQGYGRMEYA